MRTKNYVVMMSLLVSVLMMTVLPFAGAHSKVYMPDPVTVLYSSNSPTLDGNISTNEYKDASFISWNDTGACGQANDTIHIYAQRDVNNLYIAVEVTNDISDNSTFGAPYPDSILLAFDVDNDGILDFNINPAPWVDYATYGDTNLVGNYGNGSGTLIDGFNATNHTTTPHRIWEFQTSTALLPRPGEIFGVAIWGMEENCNTFETFNTFAYPESAWNDTQFADTMPEVLNASRMANWTLGMFPPPAPSPVDKLGAFGTYMLIANIAITSAMITARDPDFVGERMDVASANIGVSFIILVLGFVQGWATFT